MTISSKPVIAVDGSLFDWTTSDLINFGDGTGYSMFARAQDGMFYFGIGGPLAIGANTTAWFNTDLDATTGYQIFGFAGGAEYNLNIKADGTAALYTGAAGETLVLDNIQLAYSADLLSIEFAIPKAALGNPGAIDTLYDVNDSVFLPASYSAQPYVVYNDIVTRTDPTHRIGIVYSATPAANYFSETAYVDLFLATQSQAMQAGISYDLLTEADLTDLAKLANYDALVFPSFTNVQTADVAAITDTLLQATRQFGVGLITSGNFMTNDATGTALAGDSYARMKLLFDATRVTGGTGDVTINSSDATQAVLTNVAPDALIRSYTNVGWDAFESVSGTGQAIATETVGGQTYTAALATQTTGGRNVLFSTPGVMADSNLLWQAINYVAKDPGISVSLELSRFNGIVVSRTDMDQAQERSDVSPENGSPGIYDLLLPILAQWKQTYNFVGSYYVDIGNNPANGQFTDWAISAPYYAQFLAMGNELGTHSYTHPENTNVLTPAQIQFEFEQSKLLIEQQMSAYLEHPFTIAGAAVPGMPEFLPTSEQIAQYFAYINGGAVFVGSGYPGAFGFLSPDLTSSVYLAPNTSFDFTLVDFQHHTAAEAGAIWAQEWNALVANANLPIVVWPWHDYGPTQWALDGVASAYTLQMFTDWIERAYLAGDEFITAAELASRIQSFAQSGVTSTVSGNVIAVTVTSAHAGDFALDVAGQGSQVIANAANWYAYDSDSLFLPETGGTYTITLGAAADDVTHITALPMRADLLAVTGDGLNLSFSMFGEGNVVIDLGPHGSGIPTVSGAAIASFVGDRLELTLSGLGRNDVSISLAGMPPIEVVGSVAFSADTGVSSTDLVTAVATQTISGTLSSTLKLGNVVKVSFDNGQSWLTASTKPGDTTFSIPGVTLGGSGTLITRVENAYGVPGVALARPYVLDQTPPNETATIATMTGDSGVPGDFTTNNGEGGRTVSSTISGPLGPDATVQVSFDSGASWTAATVTGAGWSVIDSGSHAEGWTIQARVGDLAGNLGATASRSVTLDTTPPSTSLAMAPASDSGLYNTDSITKVSKPTFTGMTEGGSTVILFDGKTQIGTGVAAATGQWSISAVPTLTNGTHSITAQATDVAGNVGVASEALSVVIDTAAPAAPTAPDLLVSSDSGTSPTDNLTRIATPIFSGMAEVGSMVTLFDGITAIGTGIAATGSWSITTSKLTDGTHSITAKTTDLAGNMSAASSAISVKIDTKAPLQSSPDLSASSDTGVSNTDNITRTTTPIFAGTAEVGSTVRLFDGSTEIGNTTASSDGSWRFTGATFGQGSHAIATTVTDTAGNTGSASAALFVIIDMTAPSAPAFTGLTANSNGSATLVGTAEATGIVTVSDLSAQLGTATVGGTGVWSFKTVAGLTDTLHVFTASATDRAGNVGGILGSAQFGSSASNTLNSTSGNDSLMGRGGADTFSFQANFAIDIISDFAAVGSSHDVINFHANGVLNSFGSVLTHAVQSGSSVVISQDVGNTLTLRNVTLGSLNPSGFTFV